MKRATPALFFLGLGLVSGTTSADWYPAFPNADNYYDFNADTLAEPNVCAQNHSAAACDEQSIGCVWFAGTTPNNSRCEKCSVRDHSHCLGNCVWEANPGRCVNQEVHQIHQDCGGMQATTCYSNTLADVKLTLPSGKVTPFTAADVDPGNYYRADSEVFGNLAFYNPPQGNPRLADGLLVVFMPGCGNRPQDYTHFLLRAAKYGYHAISVPYWNVCDTTWEHQDDLYYPASGKAQCQQQMGSNTGYPGTYFFISPWFTFPHWYMASNWPTDEPAQGGVPNVDQCLTRLQRYKWDNSNANDLWFLGLYHFNVPNDGQGGDLDNVQNRTLKWLQFLDAHFNDQNWSQFFTPSGVDWSKVTLVGHSQGTGMVPWAMQTADPFRGIMISGPDVSINPPDDPLTESEVPTFVWSAEAMREDMFNFYGDLDTGNDHYRKNAIAMKLPRTGKDDALALVCHDSQSFIEVDQTSDCTTRPRLSTLQSDGGHTLMAASGNHNSVRGQIGEARPWHYQTEWDYLLTAQNGPGGRCPPVARSNEWCQSGVCNAGFCQ